MSLATGEIPDDWRQARVVPIHKMGSRLLPDNYRPVSMTSQCCKMLEHVIAKFIRDFLVEHKVLSDYQHGFRQGMSTVTQLVSTLHDLFSVLDTCGQVDVLFMDFCKAFDKVPHGKLLYKLERIGLPFCVIRWISAYLKNKKTICTSAKYLF